MRNRSIRMNYQTLKLAFIGGDARQLYAAEALAQKGVECAVFGFDTYTGTIGLCTKCDTPEDAVNGATGVVLPIPATCDGITVNAPFAAGCILLNEIFAHAAPNAVVLYGGGCLKLEKLAARREASVSVVNYAERKDFQTAGAVPTAEGALEIALRELPITLSETTALVVGYGRIGKVLCRLLNAFGAKVYASARKSEDLVSAKICGCRPVYTDAVGEVAGACDLIINTVPKPVLTAETLAKLRKDALVIDLASRPGGVDFEGAKKAGIKTLWALGLPGKTAPVSAGKILADTVLTVLEQREGGKAG